MHFCVMQVYKQYIKLTFSVIIPLLILLVLNLRIFLAMRKSRLRFDPPSPLCFSVATRDEIHISHFDESLSLLADGY
jgi:hypothetical protein